MPLWVHTTKRDIYYVTNCTCSGAIPTGAIPSPVISTAIWYNLISHLSFKINCSNNYKVITDISVVLFKTCLKIDLGQVFNKQQQQVVCINILGQHRCHIRLRLLFPRSIQHRLYCGQMCRHFFSRLKHIIQYISIHLNRGSFQANSNKSYNNKNFTTKLDGNWLKANNTLCTIIYIFN